MILRFGLSEDDAQEGILVFQQPYERFENVEKSSMLLHATICNKSTRMVVAAERPGGVCVVCVVFYGCNMLPFTFYCNRQMSKYFITIIMPVPLSLLFVLL